MSVLNYTNSCHVLKFDHFKNMSLSFLIRLDDYGVGQALKTFLKCIVYNYLYLCKCDSFINLLDVKCRTIWFGLARSCWRPCYG